MNVATGLPEYILCGCLVLFLCFGCCWFCCCFVFLFVERRCRQKPVWGHLRPLWLGKGSDLCLSLWTHSFAPSSISPVGAFPRKKDGWPSGKRVMMDVLEQDSCPGLRWPFTLVCSCSSLPTLLLSAASPNPFGLNGHGWVKAVIFV